MSYATLENGSGSNLFFSPANGNPEQEKRGIDSHSQGGNICRVMLSSGGKGSGSSTKTEEGLTEGSRT